MSLTHTFTWVLWLWGIRPDPGANMAAGYSLWALLFLLSLVGNGTGFSYTMNGRFPTGFSVTLQIRKGISGDFLIIFFFFDGWPREEYKSVTDATANDLQHISMYKKKAEKFIKL